MRWLLGDDYYGGFFFFFFTKYQLRPLHATQVVRYSKALDQLQQSNDHPLFGLRSGDIQQMLLAEKASF